MNRRTLAMLAATGGVAMLAAPTLSTADATPPTLSGEQLLDPAPSVSAMCDVGGTSTISFTAQGTATGPYPGTFTEVGTATIGPQQLDQNGTPAGFLLSVDAVFTIHSPTGDVTGTKTLVLPITDPGTQVAIGQCGDVGGDPTVHLANVNAHSTVHYDAEISAPGGDFADRGTDPLVFLNKMTTDAGRVLDQQFIETFASDLTAPQPLTSPGAATGGGQIAGNITFGLTARSDRNGLKGTCTLIDRASSTMLKCLDVTAYFQSGTHAVFRGDAAVNGNATTYRITVDDNGEPGAGVDAFSITTASGYGAAGILGQGNLQVHP